MLDRVDRLLIAVADARTVAERWCALFDAQIERENKVPALNSQRVVVRIGESELEIHQPLGEGPIADHARAGAGPFAVGLASKHLNDLIIHLQDQNIEGVFLGGEEHYFDDVSLGIHGLRVVLSPHRPHERVGLLETLYECTHLTDNAEQAAADIAQIFGLKPSNFVPIESETYGYRGSLTLFDSKRLHRIETIDPYDREKTMGRFYTKFGPSLYMGYGEAADLAPIRERLKKLAPKAWTGSDEDPNGLFVHPAATGSIMLGVSRTTYAWTWSGYPDRVKPPG
ncbi:MAG: hypothetical protein R3E82_09975 [Pseudomonadales bacterium]